MKESPELEAEFLVGRMLGKTLEEVWEIPRVQFLGWIHILKKYGTGL